MGRMTERAEDGSAIVRTENGFVDISYVGYPDGVFFGDVIDRLAEYEEAEEQGMLVSMPCPIGTPCYKIWQFGSDQKVLDWKFYYEDIPEYGISVFLDRNEAEATIKKGE